MSIPKLRNTGRWGLSETGSGNDSRTTYSQLENNRFINVGGTILEVESIDIDDKAGDDDTIYTVKNILTGETRQVIASESDSTRKDNDRNLLDIGAIW